MARQASGDGASRDRASTELRGGGERGEDDADLLCVSHTQDMRSRELANDAKAFLRDQCFAYTVSSATVAAAVDGKQDEASVLKNKATAMLKATKDLIDCLTDTLLDVPGGMPTRAGQKGEEDKKVYGDLLLALLDGLVVSSCGFFSARQQD